MPSQPSIELPPAPSFAGRQRITRRQFLGTGALAVLGTALYSCEIARHHVDIQHRSILIPSLPEQFRGFRIALIADLHYGVFTEPLYLEHVVKLVNSLQPDLIAMAGDFVTSGELPNRFSQSFAYQCADRLAHFQCKQRFAVLGNHDVAAGPVEVADALTTHGITLLRNSAVPVERDGRRLWIAGVHDVMYEKPDLKQALPRAVSVDREPVVLLAHEPDYVIRAVQHRVDLMLSGHTHGGQVRVPFLPPLVLPPLGQNYVAGHFQVGGTQLYVNRGIGTIGLPFRLFCDPEITLLTLLPS